MLVTDIHLQEVLTLTIDELKNMSINDLIAIWLTKSSVGTAGTYEIIDNRPNTDEYDIWECIQNIALRELETSSKEEMINKYLGGKNAKV